MKKIFRQSSLVLSTAMVVLTTLGNYSANAAVTKPGAASVGTTNVVSEELVVPKSVFQDDLKNGKDPFFPKSARRVAKAPTVDEKIIPPVVQLALKGISGPTNRRFALINNQPLAEGESAFVRIAGGQVKVHCWEIHDNSVIVSIEGDPERKELRLREGL